MYPRRRRTFFPRNQRFRWCRPHSWSKPCLLILASWDAGVTKELASSSSDAPASWFVWRHVSASVLWPGLCFQVVIPTPLSDAEIGAMWGAALEGEESPTKRSRPGLVHPCLRLRLSSLVLACLCRLCLVLLFPSCDRVVSRARAPYNTRFLPCGMCARCRAIRARGWVFRLWVLRVLVLGGGVDVRGLGALWFKGLRGVGV